MAQSIRQKQDAFVTLFNDLNDWLLQYELLMSIAGEMENYPIEQKDDDHLVEGCQSKAWVLCSCEGGKLRVRADSEALIVKGMIGVVVELLNGADLEEAAHADIDFISRTSLKDQITADRSHGMQRVIETMQEFARKVQEKGKQHDQEGNRHRT